MKEGSSSDRQGQECTDPIQMDPVETIARTRGTLTLKRTLKEACRGVQSIRYLKGLAWQLKAIEICTRAQTASEHFSLPMI